MRLNPFSKRSKKHEAAEGALGTALVEQLAAVVDEAPGIIEATQSGVRPESIPEPTVNVVAILLDNTTSATNLQQILGQSHDLFVNALKPALKEGVATLVMCLTMDGKVVYRLTHLNEVPLFNRGTEEQPSYEHMNRQFNLITHTPLRDRAREIVAALEGELVNWENPEVARQVNLILAVMTDGLDTSSKTKPAELSKLIGDIEDLGNYTGVATFIGEVDDKFRFMLERNIVFTLSGNTIDRYSINGPTDLLRKYGHFLPEGHDDMTTEELLRWWFYEQGLAAESNRLFLPGTDPKAIRRAVGQMSQVAYSASVNAYTEPDAEPVTNPVFAEEGPAVHPISEERGE